MVESGTVSVRLGRLLLQCSPHCVLFHRNRTWDFMLHVFIAL